MMGSCLSNAWEAKLLNPFATSDAYMRNFYTVYNDLLVAKGLK